MQRTRGSLIAVPMIAPAAALALLAFDSGGYYPGSTSGAALAALGVLAVWAVLGPRPAAGLGRSAAIGFGLLAGFAAWTLLSAAWSHEPWRALVECDRTLLYLAVFTTFALAGRSESRARGLVATLAFAAVLVSVVALVAWLLPDVVRVSGAFDRRRLSYPTGYWNTTGLIAGLGFIWCLHLTSTTNEPRFVRVLGAAPMVPLLAVVGFSASRGAVMATVTGVVAYALAARSRMVLLGLLVGAAALAGALLVVTEPTAISTNKLLPGAIDAGRRAFGLAAACTIAVTALRVGSLALEDRLALLDARPLSGRVRTRAASAVMLAVAVAVAVAVTVLAASGQVSRAYHGFTSPPSRAPGLSRLTSLSADWRTAIWNVSLRHGFLPHPLLGSGAGTFGELWNRYRPAPVSAAVPHSLLIGVLGELGLVGFVLLIGFLLVAVAAIVRLARHARAGLTPWAALAGALAAWLVFAAFDWSWQMPACTVWVFAAGGLALAAPVTRERASTETGSGRRARSWILRVTVAGSALAACLIPHAVIVSEARLASAVLDLQRNDCASAERQAELARASVPQRPEPDMVLAYCEARGARYQAALRFAARAVEADPADWEVHYAQGLVEAAAGAPSRSALTEAVRRDPFGIYATHALSDLAGIPRATTRLRAQALPLPLAVRSCDGPTSPAEPASCANPRLPTLSGGALLGPGATLRLPRPPTPAVKSLRGVLRRSIARAVHLASHAVNAVGLRARRQPRRRSQASRRRASEGRRPPAHALGLHGRALPVALRHG